MTDILFIVALFLIFFGALMFIRNEWVYKQRTAELNKCIPGDPTWQEFYDKYNALPSYDKMLFRFWIWDIERFRDD